MNVDAASRAADPSGDDEVLVELDRIRKGRVGVASEMFVLVVAIVLYLVASAQGQIWRDLAVLGAVLLLHDFGHFAAMRLLKCRDVRRFFLPYFGAALRRYPVATGWRSSVVALAGPVPGVVLGVVLIVTASESDDGRLLLPARILFVVNGFDLLPVLPLDGGCVARAVFFSRRPRLAGTFRLVTATSLLTWGILAHNWFVAGVMVFLLLDVACSSRMAFIAQRFREIGSVQPAGADGSIPPESALRILHVVRQAIPQKAPNLLLARDVSDVHDAIFSQPLGLRASLGLLLLHGAAFAAAVSGIGATSLASQPVP